MPAQHATHGGDWCETFALSDSVVALSIGDVSGHGVDVFPAMAAVRDVIRRAAERGEDPARVLAEANAFFYQREPELLATALLVLLNTRLRTITFANAGHPPPLMVTPGGPQYLEYRTADVPLGVGPVLNVALRTVDVPADTLLVLYTDGVTEHDRNPLRGELQLRYATLFAYLHAGRSTAGVIEREMLLTGPNRDDVAILTAWTPRTLTLRSG